MKLKTLKGVGCQPSKKDNGFLSIEHHQEKSMVFLVYRNFMGSTQFSSMISQNGLSKVKELTDKPGKFRVKVAVSVINPSSGKPEPEHCNIRFMTEEDSAAFVLIFSELSGTSEKGDSSHVSE